MLAENEADLLYERSVIFIEYCFEKMYLNMENSLKLPIPILSRRKIIS